MPAKWRITPLPEHPEDYFWCYRKDRILQLSDCLEDYREANTGLSKVDKCHGCLQGSANRGRYSRS